MSDAVFDATVITYSNRGLLETDKTEYASAGIALLTKFVSSTRRIRVNPKLVREYEEHNVRRSDLIELFLTLLTSDRTVHSKKNTLPTHLFLKSRKAGWPTHDQHLLAAADDGAFIYVTEQRHSVCSAKIKRDMSISVVRIAIDSTRF